jgi:hypothetical protein
MIIQLIDYKGLPASLLIDGNMATLWSWRVLVIDGKQYNAKVNSRSELGWQTKCGWVSYSMVKRIISIKPYKQLVGNSLQNI